MGVSDVVGVVVAGEELEEEGVEEGDVIVAFVLKELLEGEETIFWGRLDVRKKERK